MALDIVLLNTVTCIGWQVSAFLNDAIAENFHSPNPFGHTNDLVFVHYREITKGGKSRLLKTYTVSFTASQGYKTTSKTCLILSQCYV